MKTFSKIVLGAFLATLLGIAGYALATNSGSTSYFGWNPLTGLETVHGSLVSGGTSPTSGASTSCGTLGTISGGATAGSIVAGAVTTCTLQVVFPSAAPNGWVCVFYDVTTPADAVHTASSSTTSCTTSAATIVSGDTIVFTAIGY